MSPGTANCIDILLAVILPLWESSSSSDASKYELYTVQVEFWICLLLTLLGYLPGIIYAVYAITK
ncbi:unnamed protein product [Spirodela intermedia]|uniref:Uncharacterized protein n=1 Tax=Spirodela intermedia TaxID=51605 RepID=A0A7I8I876_SPIIN|nr:unnamed protein product [Spirodela intermedia]CAA6653825.1 unnamed protein product [Spirodela intermedia]